MKISRPIRSFVMCILAAALILPATGCRQDSLPLPADTAETTGTPETTLEETEDITQKAPEQTDPVTEAPDSGDTIPETTGSDIPADPEPLLVYVSPTGSDSEGDGSADKPFGTLGTAVAQLRSITEPCPCEIILMDGDYYVTDTVKLTAEDTARCTTLRICAQNSGKVRFIGGISVDSSLCKPVTDSAMLDRIVDKDAAGKLMMLDLSSVVTEFPEISLYYPMEVYLNDQALTMSRWPNNVRNEAYLRAETVVSVNESPKNGPMTFTYADATDRAARWSEESLENLYILSHLGVDWFNDWLKVTALDAATRTVTTENGGTYGATEGNRFFFFNLPEEIDVPGESYVDREARVVYFYPYADATEEIFVSTMTGIMLELDGCENVTLEGLRFEYTRSRAISARAVTGLTVRDCDIRSMVCHKGSYEIKETPPENTAPKNNHGTP